MQLKKVIFSLVFTLLGAILALQIKAVLADSTDPISAPLSSPITITPTPTDTPVLPPSPTLAPTVTAIPTPTPTIEVVNSTQNNQSSGNTGNNNNQNNSQSSASAPICNDQKPTDVPHIFAVMPTGLGQVTLFWTKVSGPATHYLISYGLKTGQAMYGNPNVGGINNTKFAVNELVSNTKYYFKVAAVNGCMPGDFSNEVSAIATRNYSVVPANFNFGVLGISHINHSQLQPKTQKNVGKYISNLYKPNRIVESANKTSNNVFSFILNFFFHK